MNGKVRNGLPISISTAAPARPAGTARIVRTAVRHVVHRRTAPQTPSPATIPPRRRPSTTCLPGQSGGGRVAQGHSPNRAASHEGRGDGADSAAQRDRAKFTAHVTPKVGWAARPCITQYPEPEGPPTYRGGMEPPPGPRDPPPAEAEAAATARTLGGSGRRGVVVALTPRACRAPGLSAPPLPSARPSGKSEPPALPSPGKGSRAHGAEGVRRANRPSRSSGPPIALRPSTPPHHHHHHTDHHHDPSLDAR
jgi:hypothetical protein